MPSPEAIDAIVKNVLTATPLPDDVDDLDADTRRQIERRADEEGRSITDLYGQMKAQNANLLADSEEVAAIVKAVRRF